MKTKTHSHIVEAAVHHFKYVAKNIASHTNVLDENIYPQPSSYLTTHFICMKVAGFNEIDFDGLTAVSGVSALFAYFPGDFMPKYAHLHINISKRIEEATGFGWERLAPGTAEECFEIIKESIDSEKPVKSTYYEDILFVGYSESAGKRKVYVMTDGADYFIHWFSWKEFQRWFKDWGDSKAGRFTERKNCMPGKEIAFRVLNDLVQWSIEPPAEVIKEYPGAKFGLKGIEQYANDCGDIAKFSDWRACHDINPQWITRKSTAVYLKGLADDQIFDQEVNIHLLKSSELYEESYKQWRIFYKYLGHGSPKNSGKKKETRLKGAEAIHRALDYEKKALAEIRKGIAQIN